MLLPWFDWKLLCLNLSEELAEHRNGLAFEDLPVPSQLDIPLHLGLSFAPIEQSSYGLVDPIRKLILAQTQVVLTESDRVGTAALNAAKLLVQSQILDGGLHGDLVLPLKLLCLLNKLFVALA